jgi:hypothetical protein
VGSPLAVFVALVEAINARDATAQYTIEATPLFNTADFWLFAKENAGEVTKITFELVAPNSAWSTETDMKEEMRKFREEVGAEEVVTTFKSKVGLDTDSPQIKNGVTYAGEVGGIIRAVTRLGRKFNSTHTPITTKLDDRGDDTGSAIARVAKSISRILGR